MTNKEKVEWYCRILLRLNNKGYEWGCLSSQNTLFEISTMESVNVPKQIVQTLIRDGLIKLEQLKGKQKPYYFLTSKSIYTANINQEQNNEEL